MSNVLKIKRGTRTQIDTAGTNNQLIQGEPYLITDEGRLAVGLTSATYSAFAKTSEIQPLDGDLTAIAGLTGTGILTRTGTDTWSLDTNTYLTTGTAASTYLTISNAASNYQPLDADLTAIAGITATTGLLKKTAANTWTLDTNTYLTGNQTITVSGDASGSGTTSISVTLASVGTAGTYTKVTTDSKGRVTAGTTLSASDIPTLTASKISDFDTQVRTSRLDQMAAPTASVNLNSQKITGLATPTQGTDAANKDYVDSAVQGLTAKDSVKVATTANITLSGTQTIDGIAVVAGDRVLVKNQTTANQNGVYVVAAGAWSRATDSDTWNELISAYYFVEQGTANGDNGYLITVDAGGTLGVTDVTVVQFSGAGQITAGAGLTKTGNQLDIVGTTNRITVNADSIDIASTYVGQSSITTLGTITTGTWNATTIATTKGGTGLTSYTTGDIVYASATDTLAKLAKPAVDTSILFMNSNGTPSWSNVIDGGTF